MNAAINDSVERLAEVLKEKEAAFKNELEKGFEGYYQLKERFEKISLTENEKKEMTKLEGQITFTNRNIESLESRLQKLVVSDDLEKNMDQLTKDRNSLLKLKESLSAKIEANRQLREKEKIMEEMRKKLSELAQSIPQNPYEKLLFKIESFSSESICLHDGIPEWYQKVEEFADICDFLGLVLGKIDFELKVSDDGKVYLHLLTIGNETFEVSTAVIRSEVFSTFGEPKGRNDNHAFVLHDVFGVPLDANELRNTWKEELHFEYVIDTTNNRCINNLFITNHFVPEEDSKRYVRIGAPEEIVSLREYDDRDENTTKHRPLIVEYSQYPNTI